jgi:transposase
MPEVIKFDKGGFALGWSYEKIVTSMKCSKFTVQHTFVHYCKRGEITNKATPGRPRLISPRESQLIERTSLGNRCTTVPGNTAKFQELF